MVKKYFLLFSAVRQIFIRAGTGIGECKSAEIYHICIKNSQISHNFLKVILSDFVLRKQNVHADKPQHQRYCFKVTVVYFISCL